MDHDGFMDQKKEQMKSKIIIVISLLCLLNGMGMVAQEGITGYTLKKGEVLDVLFLTQKQEKDSLFKDYVRVAFPIAIQMGYKNLTGRQIVKSTQGNIEPQNVVFAKWDNRNIRERFIQEIETHVPDFHQQRRNIWSIFNLTYYEMSKDVSFAMDKDKFYTITAYWKKDGEKFNAFVNTFDKVVKRFGGTHILELRDGISPFMYHYQPDYFVMTEWEDKKQFELFYQENLKMDTKGLLNVNQFVIE